MALSKFIPKIFPTDMQLHACVLEGKTLPQYARDWARIPIIPKTLLLPLSGVKTLLEKRVLLYSLPHSPQHFQSVKHCVFGEWNISKYNQSFRSNQSLLKTKQHNRLKLI